MTIFNVIPLIGLLAIIIIITVRIIFLKIIGIKVNAKTGKRKSVKWMLFVIFGVFFLVWLFEIVQTVFFRSVSIFPEFVTKLWFDSTLLKIAGTLVVIIDLVLWITTLLHFKTSLRFGLDQNNPGKLVTSGIFAKTRNPFFLSLDLYFAGIALILPNLFFVVFAAFAIVSIHFFILKEEKFLIKIYGEEYANYIQKVRRYF